jgi:hypothetical protein
VYLKETIVVLFLKIPLHFLYKSQVKRLGRRLRQEDGKVETLSQKWGKKGD